MGYEVVCDSRDRERWLGERRTGIGASEAPAILGEGRFGNALTVYAQKKGALENTVGEAAEWGRALEPAIAQKLAGEIGHPAVADGMMYRSKERPWLYATIDWRVLQHPDWLPYEIKATSRDWEDQVPIEVWIQVQHQLAVLDDRSGSYVGALLPGLRGVWTLVQRDDGFITKELLPRLEAFWRRIENDEPPPPPESNPARSIEALKALYPEESGELIELPESALAWHERLSDLQALERKTKRGRQEMEAMFRAAMGDASIGMLPDGTRVTLHKIERKGYSVPPSSFRQLKFKSR